MGVLFSVDPNSLAGLDAAEGAPGHYRSAPATVRTQHGDREAITYFAQPDKLLSVAFFKKPQNPPPPNSPQKKKFSPFSPPLFKRVAKQKPEGKKNGETLYHANAQVTKPWREIAVPHPDVLEGTFQQSEFAADITAVRTGKAGPNTATRLRSFRGPSSPKACACS